MQAGDTVEMGPGGGGGGGTVLQEKAGKETSPHHTILYLLLLKSSLCTAANLSFPLLILLPLFHAPCP